MSTFIQRPQSGDRFELQGVLARLLDVSLILTGAMMASLLFRPDATHPLVMVAFVVTFAMVIFPAFGVYRSWLARSRIRLSGNILLAWIVTHGCGLALIFALLETSIASSLWCICWMVITGAGLTASRLVAHAVLGRMRRVGHDLCHVAIVGVGRHCDEVVDKIETSPDSGFRAVALLTTRSVALTGCPDLETYSDLSAFAAFVRANQIAEVWLALPMSEDQTVRSVMDVFRDDLVNIRLIPDVRSLSMFDCGMVDLMGVPAINLVASPLPKCALIQKAMFDRVFAAVALTVLMPLLVAIAVAVKLSSKGPVLFTQRRRGADGKVFRIYKFRSMRIHDGEAGMVKQATRCDPRITRVGSILRRTSLDELPQFLNVLRGEMSVVGPRPHAIEHDDLYQKLVDGYIHRYRIKPGITGWAQVNGLRGETDCVEKMQSRVEHDLYYLRNWSFALDMRIVMATIRNGFVHLNAY